MVIKTLLDVRFISPILSLPSPYWSPNDGHIIQKWRKNLVKVGVNKKGFVKKIHDENEKNPFYTNHP
jgi:hypothetical protein